MRTVLLVLAAWVGLSLLLVGLLFLAEVVKEALWRRRVRRDLDEVHKLRADFVAWAEEMGWVEAE